MLSFSCASYEKAFPRTTSGTIKIKDIPELKALRAEKSGGRYFANANGLFRMLFRYINKNGVAMTVPVETRIEPAAMIFFVGRKDVAKQLEDTKDVKVIIIPARTVVSIGVMGGYTEANFSEAKKKLQEWLGKNTNYRATGEAYAVYWNSPFVPYFLKKAEVNIPVEKVENSGAVSD